LQECQCKALKRSQVLALILDGYSNSCRRDGRLTASWTWWAGSLKTKVMLKAAVLSMTHMRISTSQKISKTAERGHRRNA
jgi:hypothetical protein